MALSSALPTHAYSQYYNLWRHFPVSGPAPAPAQPHEPRIQADVLARVSRDHADTAAFFQYLNVPAPKVRWGHRQLHLPVTVTSAARSTSLGGAAAAPPTTSPATSRGGATGRPVGDV